MPVKRSRVGSSSACLETSVATSSQVKVVKTAAAAAERPPSKFLTVASPVNDGECGRTKIGEFLERCHYCSKRIATYVLSALSNAVTAILIWTNWLPKGRKISQRRCMKGRTEVEF